MTTTTETAGLLPPVTGDGDTLTPIRSTHANRTPAVLGGLALALVPVTWTVGVFTSPPQDSTSHVDYVASMARAPFQAVLSANFLHYSWLLLVLGVMAAMPLFRGRRGSRVGLTVSILSIVTAIQISGLLLSDWYAVRVSQESGVKAAAAIEFDLGTSANVWLWTGKVAALFVPLLFCSLAYSRVISWWLVLVFVLGSVIAFLPIPVALAAPAMVISWAPAYAVAWQLVTGRRRA
jgi:hypothetical protein